MRGLIYLLVLGAAAVLNGCVNVGQDARKVDTYMLSVERDLPAAEQSVLGDLLIERVIAMQPYGSRNFTLQISDAAFESTYYSELLVSPAENFQGVMEVKVSLRDSEGKVVLSKTYYRRSDLQDLHISHAVIGWNRSILEILQDLERDIIAASR